jgi:hypothetical protein
MVLLMMVILIDIQFHIDSRVLTTVYNTQNYWDFRLCPSSGILKTRRQPFRNWISFRPQVMGETPTLLGPLERANLNHWTTHVSITTAT